MNSWILYIRDLHDQIVHDLESLESFRNVLDGEIYISEVSFNMNQIVQVLVIMSVLFIPLSFIARGHKMNFDIIPEFRLVYGY